MENENVKSIKSIFDIAAIITVSGIFLYVLGYLSLRNYYTVLQVPLSFLDLTVEKVLIKTWTVLLLAILGFIPVFFQIFIKNFYNEDLPLKETIIYLVGSILVMLIGVLFSGSLTWKDCLLMYILILPIVFITVYLGNRLTSEKKVEKSLYLYFILGVFPIASMFVYSFKGKALGEIEKSKYEDDIEITLNHDNTKINGKYILFSNNKYIIMIENNKCEKETLVINNEEVSYVRFISTAVYK